MTLSDLYTKRDVNIISIDSEESINKIYDTNINEISKIVLSFEQNNRLTHMDFGSWCYSKTKTDRGNVGCLVDLNSFDLDRVVGVKFLLEDLLSIRKSKKTILYFYKESNPIFGYLNKNYSDYVFSNIQDAEKIYIGYSKYLFNDLAIKKASSVVINADHHRQKQDILAKFLSACTKTNINHFYALVKRINVIKLEKPLNKDEIDAGVNKKVKILLDVFNVMSDHILNENDLPCVIDLEHHNLKKIYIDLNFVNKSQDFFLKLLYEDNKIVSIDRFNRNMDKYFENFEYYDGALKKRINRKRYHEKIKGIERLNSLQFKECGPKVIMANFCMIIFAKLFISTSGANESVLYNLMKDGSTTIGNEKGKRVYGKKNRAGGKVVALEFGLKFQEVFNKYMKLRDKINTFYSDMPEEFKKLLFIKLPVMNNATSYKLVMKIDSQAFDHFNKIFKMLFGISTATNKELRSNVGNSYFNSTNSSLMTSQKLGNTPQISSESYSKASFKEVATQFNNYFKEFDNTVIFKGRKHLNLIPIKVESDNEINTFVGNCSNGKPELIEGFNNETPLPICGNPKSCLYCDSYVLHLNRTDIKKILSFKFILEYNTQIKDEQQRIIYRIDEILKFMILKESSLDDLINDVWNEVSEGFLDEYWDNHLNLLVEIGELA
ncbi:hypothetical protein F909_01842 [Acinetobacter sp. ANC 3929]|uniref:hypothetical protein n=1 Tax=Acinetobacter TaxID=469 RepID=UPI0002CE9BE0|nr:MULTISPECIES: hypothetical protein [Acinetobacter]ENW80556.1 hypothetical protein F909_01842 [Acinetobacter sp. ANC 3929]